MTYFISQAHIESAKCPASVLDMVTEGWALDCQATHKAASWIVIKKPVDLFLISSFAA